MDLAEADAVNRVINYIHLLRDRREISGVAKDDASNAMIFLADKAHKATAAGIRLARVSKTSGSPGRNGPGRKAATVARLPLGKPGDAEGFDPLPRESD